MASEWIGVIGALGGTLIGGGVAGGATYLVARQQHKHQRASEDRARFITACEEIHELFTQVAGQSNEASVAVVGDLGHGRRIQGDVFKDAVKLSRLQMLIDFYVPALRPHFDRFNAQFIIVVRALAETLTEQDRNDVWRSKTAEKCMVAAVAASDVAGEAQVELASLFRQA